LLTFFLWHVNCIIDDRSRSIIVVPRCRVRVAMSMKTLAILLFPAILMASCSMKLGSSVVEAVWDDIDTNPKLPIGMNLADINYWAPGVAFSDVMTTNSGLFTSYANGPFSSGMIGEIPLDENGYPRSLPVNTSDGHATFARFLISNQYSGKYRIFYEGTGTFGAAAVLENGKYYVTLNGSGENTWIDICTSSASDHVRKIRILPASYADPTAAPKFLPAFLDGLRPFHAIRFMDWTKTNNSTQVEWSDRVTPDGVTQGGDRGICWEYAIDLCNELDADAWVCVPHKASDAYITAMATLWRDRLESGRKVYLEYSNEVWNWGFEQTRWVNDNAPGAANSYVTSDLAALGAAGKGYMHKDAYMMARVFRLWGNVFSGQGGRVVNVATGQAAWAGNSDLIMDYLVNTAHAPVEALAVGGYFYYSEEDHRAWAADPASVTAGLICDAAYNEMGGTTIAWANESAAVAKKYGVPFLVYEGGQHMPPYNQQDWSYNDKLYAAQIHPKMYQLYLRDFSAHVDAGCQLFMAYHFMGSRKSKYGSWGHLESLGDVGKSYSVIAPKYQALLDCNTQK
jgi:hypothetical protein